MSKQTKRFGAVVLTSAALLGAGATTASAASSTAIPATLSGVQAAASAAITLRVNDLNAAIAKVNAAKDLGAGGSTLASYLGVDILPLQALGQKIAGDSSLSTAQADYESIFSDYRVLALVLPAARLAASSDGIDNGDVPYFTTASADAAKHVNATNQATLEPLIDNLNSQISAASNATVGVASTVMGYVPAQWNANNQLLASAKSSISSATGALHQARSDVQQIRAYLKASHPATPTTPTT
jgi:hypothetical protein